MHERTPPTPSEARLGSLRVALLGANLWLVLVVLPAAFGGVTAPLRTAALAALAAAPLALGARWQAQGRSAAAAWAWLAGAPAAFALAVVGIHPTLEEAPGPGPGWIVAAVALVLFGAAAAAETARPARLRPSRTRPLDEPARPAAAPRRGERMRRGLLLVAGAGAFALAVGPTATVDAGRLAADWGEAQREAATLLAAVSAALGTAVVALFVGPGLRASRERPPTRAEVRGRVSGALFAAALAGLAWLALAR